MGHQNAFEKFKLWIGIKILRGNDLHFSLFPEQVWKSSSDVEILLKFSGNFIFHKFITYLKKIKVA